MVSFTPGHLSSSLNHLLCAFAIFVALDMLFGDIQASNRIHIAFFSEGLLLSMNILCINTNTRFVSSSSLSVFNKYRVLGNKNVI